MHFTFIALTPIIDAVFLSYQYKFFACELSADGKAELMPPRGKGSPCRPGTANLPTHPDCCSSLEERCSGLVCFVGPGPNPSHKHHEGAARVRYSLQEANEPVEMTEGTTSHSGCNRPPKPHTVCTSSSLQGTSALHTSGSFWVKPQGLSTLCKERWLGDLLLDCHTVTAVWWAASEENLPGALSTIHTAQGHAPRLDLLVWLDQQQQQLPPARFECGLFHCMARAELFALLLSDHPTCLAGSHCLPEPNPPHCSCKPGLCQWDQDILRIIIQP